MRLPSVTARLLLVLLLSICLICDEAGARKFGPNDSSRADGIELVSFLQRKILEDGQTPVVTENKDEKAKETVQQVEEKKWEPKVEEKKEWVQEAKVDEKKPEPKKEETWKPQSWEKKEEWNKESKFEGQQNNVAEKKTTDEKKEWKQETEKDEKVAEKKEEPKWEKKEEPKVEEKMDQKKVEEKEEQKWEKEESKVEEKKEIKVEVKEEEPKVEEKKEESKVKEEEIKVEVKKEEPKVEESKEVSKVEVKKEEPKVEEKKEEPKVEMKEEVKSEVKKEELKVEKKVEEEVPKTEKKKEDQLPVVPKTDASSATVSKDSTTEFKENVKMKETVTVDKQVATKTGESGDFEGEVGAMDPDMDYPDFLDELRNFPERIQRTAESVKDHMSGLEKYSTQSKVLFNQANQQIQESFTPLLGKEYAPFIAYFVSYGILLLPLALVMFFFERIRAIFSLQKILLFVNIYLAAYFGALLAATIILGSEPMDFFRKYSASSYIFLQLLQAFGYLMYLLLQTIDLISTCSSGRIAAKFSAVFQWVVVVAVGFHYYVTVFHRAMERKAPLTSWKIYGLYCLSFLFLCLFARIERGKKQYSPVEVDDTTDKKN